MTYLSLLKTIWHEIYSAHEDTLKTVQKYFHPEYEQCINGITLNRTEYTDHVLQQKQIMTIESIDYRHSLEKDDQLFALYYPKGKNNKNLPIEAEVIAYFHFKQQQIYKIHGQVRLIKGDFSDVDMKTASS